ncbi:PREDICTED: L-threonine dehydratase catabolic TdcB-like isoform X2 [Priapulus caudatus]|uniref:L-serine deaminase n=1 Tax=Priapulus caudatus TaxID=37621 RepID=A0ABM1FC21_PRICU|nr:PREDICTED: L-threonine dehydratase catabolic TdcB-like isoform X2 [Priapulus caudatus]
MWQDMAGTTETMLENERDLYHANIKLGNCFIIYMEPLTYSAIVSAQDRYHALVNPSPLMLLNVNIPDTKIYLKLENLQAIGSFKLRGAINAICKLTPEQKREGVWTASKGNFARGLAWACSQEKIPCKVVVPHSAPAAKIQPAIDLGVEVIRVSLEEWMGIIFDGNLCERVTGTFIHPSFATDCIAGNGVIGLEILDTLPEVDSIVIPFGGGGLTHGISTAVKHRKPEVQIYAAEVEGAAPLKASLSEGNTVFIDCHHSFVDGIGSRTVSEEIFREVRKVVKDSIVVSPKEVAVALRLLVENSHVVAEGAGAASVAAAMTGMAGKGNIVCIVTGGCIDTDVLVKILQGELPS